MSFWKAYWQLIASFRWKQLWMCCILSCFSHVWPTRLLCPWHSPGKNARVSCHALLQGFILTQKSNWRLLHHLHCQEDSLPLVLLELSLKTEQGFFNVLAFTPIPMFKERMWASEWVRFFPWWDNWSSEKPSLSSYAGITHWLCEEGQIIQAFWASVTLSVQWGDDTYIRVISVTLTIPTGTGLQEQENSVNAYGWIADVSWDHSRQTREWSSRGHPWRSERVWPQGCHSGGTESTLHPPLRFVSPSRSPNST